MFAARSAHRTVRGNQRRGNMNSQINWYYFRKG